MKKPLAKKCWNIYIAKACAQLEYVTNQHLADGASASAQADARIGLVAHNDVVAIDVLAALRSLGLNLPLISYDNTYLAAREKFRLTSVAQPMAMMADKTLQLLVTRAQGLGSGASGNAEANDDGAGDSGDAGASGGAGTNDGGARLGCPVCAGGGWVL